MTQGSCIGDFDLKRFSLVLLAATMLPAGAAMARQDPVVQPSGKVIHLFGPNSVFNNLMPPPAGGGAAPAANNTAAPGASAPANAVAGTPASASSNGSGGLLHEMFVTGDPSVPVSERLSKGRSGSH